MLITENEMVRRVPVVVVDTTPIGSKLTTTSEEENKNRVGSTLIDSTVTAKHSPLTSMENSPVDAEEEQRFIHE